MIKSLLSYYTIYFKVLKTHRIDMCLSIGNILVNQIITISYLFVIHNNVPSLRGWSIAHMILMYGLFVMNKGTAGLITGSLYSIEGHIREGTLDGILVRPIPPIIQILGEKLEISEILNVAIGGIVTFSVIGILENINIVLTMAIILLFLVISIMVVFSIRLACMSIAFWTLTSFPIAIAVDNVSEFAKYPTTIYSKPLRFIIDYCIPFSVLAYFPADVIVHSRYTGLYASIAISIISLFIAVFIWNKGLKSYKSSGH